MPAKSAEPCKVLVDDQPQARVRVLTLSNRSRKNALDGAGCASLVEELKRAEKDGVRALVLTGDAGTFSSGYDLSEVGALRDRLDAGDPSDQTAELPDAPLVRACAALEDAPFPIIAAIDGPAFGAGAEVACACDLRIASKGATFCLPPAKLSIVYSATGTARIIRTLGLGHAKRLFMTAEVIDSGEALRLGFCSELTAEPIALPRALVLAASMAKLAPKSYAGMKKMYLRLGPHLSGAELEEMEAIRRDAFLSEDGRESRRAFAERRPPVFTGK